MDHRKGSGGGEEGGSANYPEASGEGGLVDRSASIALTKLMSTKRGGVNGGLLCSAASSSKPKNLMFNHKHLQYIPLAAQQDRRRPALPHPTHHQHQPHQTNPALPMTSLLVNGRSPGHAHQGLSYRTDPQLSPAHAQQQYADQRERHLRYPQQRLHPSPVTKSIGVGANLNYPRTGPALGRPLGQGQEESRDLRVMGALGRPMGQGQEESRDLRVMGGLGRPLGQGQEDSRDMRVMGYHQQQPSHGMGRYEVPQPRSSPSAPHGGVLSISMGHGLGHSADAMPLHHSRSAEMAPTPHKADLHGLSSGGQGQRSPMTHHRPTSPGPIKPKFSALPAPSSLSSAQIQMFNNVKTTSHKIVSQNLNGTLSVTGMPSNDSELQLFRVLQRANLLNYFDGMIELGGDDVQQLCDAGEEEFLEIMALIGMASKPLHVRRLQKSLQEFMTHPNLFPNPILGPPLSAFTHGATASDAPPSSTSTSITTSSSSKPSLPIRPIPYHSSASTGSSAHFSPGAKGAARHYNPKFHAPRIEQSTVASTGSGGSPTVSSAVGGQERSNSPCKLPGRTTPSSGNLNQNVPNSVSSPSSTSSNSSGGFPGAAPFTLPNGISVRFNSEQISTNQLLESRLREGKQSAGDTPENHSDNPDSRSSLSPVPFLQEGEIDKIRESAIRVIQTLPEEFLEPKVSGKRKAATDFETVLRIPDEDPRRADEIRKFAAIYARYNCKRKGQKPLTIHELSANEAASQLCLRLPALLTRRDDLKSLSREVIRNAGLPYSSIISASPFRDFAVNGRRTPLDANGSTDHSRPRSAPSTHTPEDMSHPKSDRPESSPATTESLGHSPSEVRMHHLPRKRATTALALTSPKERKLDDDLRTFANSLQMKHEEGR